MSKPDDFETDFETDSTDRQTDTETPDSPDPTPDDSGALSGPNEYDPMEIYDLNRHRSNGDETVVILSQFGRGFQALAIDVDKAGEILETEIIGDAEDRQSADAMCNYWVKQNPKGILGESAGDDEDEGGSFWDMFSFGGDGE